MKLKQLFKDCIALKNFDEFANLEINSIAYDTNQNLKGSVFFCLKGTNTDGHEFLQTVKDGGAVCAVVEKVDKKVDLPQILVSSARKALSLACANFFDNPSKSFKLIGITGTNGKTSTTHILRHIFMLAGKKVGVIGTLGYFIGNNHFDTNLTTPDPLQLQEIFAHFKKEKVEFAFLEVSAHAIFLEKIYGLEFEIAALTNITQDHLEFFKTMENYANTKVGFLKSEQVKSMVINVDDSSALHFWDCEFISYGLKNPADSFAVDVVSKLGETSFALNILDNVCLVTTRLSGEFNVYNALCAATISALLGIETTIIKNALESIEDINGRFNIVNSPKGKVVIDFAHTPDALKKVLVAIKKASNFKKIICVFGCNGNRDRSKRPIMGKIAEEFADTVILTSDNPRFENADLIIDDILSGVENVDNFMREVDRVKAIELALGMLDEESVVVLCGKGGEKYQDINGVMVPYEDARVVKSYLK